MFNWTEFIRQTYWSGKVGRANLGHGPAEVARSHAVCYGDGNQCQLGQHCHPGAR